MTVAGWLMYNLFVIALVGLVAFLTARTAVRRNKALSDSIAQRIEGEIARELKLARVEREQRARHRAETAVSSPHSTRRTRTTSRSSWRCNSASTRKPTPRSCPASPPLLIRSIDQLDYELGGEGVEFDEEATTEDATHLTLRLTFRDPEGAKERREEIERTLANLADAARQRLVSAQEADIRAKIVAELDSPIPHDVAARLDPLPA